MLTQNVSPSFILRLHASLMKCLVLLQLQHTLTEPQNLHSVSRSLVCSGSEKQRSWLLHKRKHSSSSSSSPSSSNNSSSNITSESNCNSYGTCLPEFLNYPLSFLHIFLTSLTYALLVRTTYPRFWSTSFSWLAQCQLSWNHLWGFAMAVAFPHAAKKGTPI
jgi:hypothetical protein